jgi:hypothetical protein
VETPTMTTFVAGSFLLPRSSLVMHAHRACIARTLTVAKVHNMH